MSRAQASFWNCNGMKLCNRKFPSAVQFKNNFLRWFSSWWLILSLVIHEKRLFLISDTDGSEEKVRVEPVTSFLKIISENTSPIRSDPQSDPIQILLKAFLYRKIFLRLMFRFPENIWLHHWSKTPLCSLFFILQFSPPEARSTFEVSCLEWTVLKVAGF